MQWSSSPKGCRAKPIVLSSRATPQYSQKVLLTCRWVSPGRDWALHADSHKGPIPPKSGCRRTKVPIGLGPLMKQETGWAAGTLNGGLSGW